MPRWRRSPSGRPASSGLSERQLGSLETGKIGNVALLDGRLGEPNTRVRWVVVDGVAYEQAEADTDGPDDAGSSDGQDSQPDPEPSGDDGIRVETDASRVPATRTGGDVVIRNATVLTMAPAGVLEQTDVLIRDGLIAQIGSDLRVPDGTVVVDATDAWVMPCIIDDHSHMASDGGINEGTLSITAQVRIEDVLRGDDLTLYRAAAGGVTTANVLHGSANTIGGQRAIIKMKYGVPAIELQFDDYPRGIKFALGENVTRRRNRFPNTRMGQEAVIRRALTEAQAYRARWGAYDAEVRRADDRVAPPRRDLRLEALGGVLNGEILVHSHGYNADELFMLLQTLDEFGVRELILEHALEAYKIAPEIVAFGNRGAFVSTFADNWAYKIEAYDAIPYNVALITEAGGRAILNSDSGERVRRLYVDAAKMVRFGGLSYRQALETITVNPAMALQIDNYVGSIEVGKRADLALFNGHPLNIYSRVFMTLVDGEVVFERTGDRGGPFPLAPKRPTPSGPAPRDVNNRYAIVNAEIHPVSGPTIPNGALVIEDGRITAIGADITPPAGTTLVDAEGMSVYPGLIDGGTTLGLNEIGGVAVTQDAADSGVIQPDLRAGVAVKPDSELIPVARFTGITSAVSAPTGGLIPGQAALIQLAGWTPAELAYVDRLALQINIPNGAGVLDLGPLFDQGNSDDDAPTADEQLARLRELFAEARTYADQRDQVTQAGQGLDAYDPALEALVPYARRERPVILGANSAAAILVAIDLAKELDVRAILRGGQEAWRVADEIAAAGLPVLLSPLTRSPSDPYDLYDSVYASPLRLHEAGGPVRVPEQQRVQFPRATVPRRHGGCLRAATGRGPAVGDPQHRRDPRRRRPGGLARCREAGRHHHHRRRPAPSRDQYPIHVHQRSTGGCRRQQAHAAVSPVPAAAGRAIAPGQHLAVVPPTMSCGVGTWVPIRSEAAWFGTPVGAPFRSCTVTPQFERPRSALPPQRCGTVDRSARDRLIPVRNRIAPPHP